MGQREVNEISNQDRRRSRTPLSRGKRIVFTSVLVLGGLGFVEALSSVYYFVHHPREFRAGLEMALGIRHTAENLVLKYRPHPYFNHVCNPGYRYPDGYRPHNSRGFRGPEWPSGKSPGTVRIVALGGSTTYGIFSKTGEDTWPALLRERLGQRVAVPVEVINLGVAAYTTHEILGVMSMVVPDLQPDIVLIHVGANEAFAVGYPEEGGNDNTRFRHAWNYRPIPGIWRFLMRHTYFFRVFGLTLGIHSGRLPGDLIPVIQYARPDAKSARNCAGTATGRYFRRNVNTLITLTRHIGARPVLITHPLNPDWQTKDGSYHALVADAHRRNNRILMDLAREEGVTCIAMHRRLQSTGFFMDAIHMNRAGMVQKARLLAEDLAPLVASPKRADPRAIEPSAIR